MSIYIYIYTYVYITLTGEYGDGHVVGDVARHVKNTKHQISKSKQQGPEQVLSGQKAATQVDVHPHDLRYNHYRCKSAQDHRDDPLRLEASVR